MATTTARRVPTATASKTEAPFEMANLGAKRTGLDFVVWISNKGGARHDVRVKVSRKPNEEPQASFAIRSGCRHEAGDDRWMTAEQKNALEKWVDLNRAVLIEFWDSQDWDHQDATERLRRL
jgi:hypothetical protein